MGQYAPHVLFGALDFTQVDFRQTIVVFAESAPVASASGGRRSRGRTKCGREHQPTHRRRGLRFAEPAIFQS